MFYNYTMLLNYWFAMNDILINSIKLNGIKSTHQTIHDWCFHC